jgi:hypothetical protein
MLQTRTSAANASRSHGWVPDGATAARHYDRALVRRFGRAAFAPGAPQVLNFPDEAEAYLRRYIASWAASGSPYAYSRLVGLGSAAWAEGGEDGDDGEDGDGSGSDSGRR